MIFTFRFAYSGAVIHPLTTLALILLATAAAQTQDNAKPVDFDWQKARGTVVDHLACLDDPSQSYSVYLPSQYTPERPWPVIYAFDPLGRGKAAVEVYRTAAEKYGYIVVGSNNSKNGPVSIQLAAAQAFWSDTHRRFFIDKNRVYVTGLSGGARAATAFALYCSTCAVAGVIAHGAGYPVMETKSAPANDHFAYYAVVGDVDFNYPEIMDLRRKKDAQGAAFKVKTYPGPHQWAPAEIVEDAIEWLEIKAMQGGTEKVDPAFVQKIFQRTQAEAARAEQAADVLTQYYALRSLVYDFKGLKDVTQFESAVQALKASKAWKSANRNEQQASDLQASLIATASGELGQLASPDSDSQPALTRHIVSVMTNLQRQAHSNAGDRAVCSRAFTQLWIQGIEAGQEQFREGHYTLAAVYFNLMAEAAPDQAWPLVLLAEARVRSGNKKGAVKALEQAVQRGVKHAATLTDDPEFQPLASDPAFQRIVQSLEGKL